jgi:hypothetical protein
MPRCGVHAGDAASRPASAQRLEQIFRAGVTD